jgi:hypothetical protein
VALPGPTARTSTRQRRRTGGTDESVAVARPRAFVAAFDDGQSSVHAALKPRSGGSILDGDAILHP